MNGSFIQNASAANNPAITHWAALCRVPLLLAPADIHMDQQSCHHTVRHPTRDYRLCTVIVYVDINTIITCTKGAACI